MRCYAFFMTVVFHVDTAISTMSQVKSVHSPIDMLYTIVSSIRDIYDQARLYASMHRAACVKQGEWNCSCPPTRPRTASGTFGPVQIPVTSTTDSATSSSSTMASTSPLSDPAASVIVSADNIFPLIVWCVVHSDVRSLHSLIGHMERFLPIQQKQFGEAGMCLSLLEAAVTHVVQATPEQYGQAHAIEVRDGTISTKEGEGEKVLYLATVYSIRWFGLLFVVMFSQPSLVLVSYC